MKYYFISFMYGASEKKLENAVIDHHPFEWQRYSNKSYRGQYILINWKEITMEEYQEYKSFKV